jgi:hypothetical protein
VRSGNETAVRRRQRTHKRGLLELNSISGKAPFPTRMSAVEKGCADEFDLWVKRHIEVHGP